MKPIKLPNRLRAIAELIRDGAAVADIGTDHGLLPVYLAETGKARRIIASDVSEGSLGAARRNAARRGVTDKIEFYCANGLDHLSGRVLFDADHLGQRPTNDDRSDQLQWHCLAKRDYIDTIVIAGVGGETIMGILARAPWALDAFARGELELFLQAQTKLDVLREFLHNSGYKTRKEISVTDRKRDYTILAVSNIQ